MDSLLSQFRTERKELARLVDPSDLPKLLAQVEKIDAELAEIRESRRANGHVHTSARESELRDLRAPIAQQVADLRSDSDRAKSRIAELDRYLGVSDEIKSAKRSLGLANGAVKEKMKRISQLGTIADSLQAEVAELEKRRSDAFAAHGRAELDARLSGKPVPPPKSIAAIDGDLESRRAALDATNAAIDAVKAELEAAQAAAHEAGNRFRVARRAETELTFFGKLGELLPTLATLSALSSSIPQLHFQQLRVDIGYEMIGVAEQQIAEEIANA